jgi:hypothetical protein
MISLSYTVHSYMISIMSVMNGSISGSQGWYSRRVARRFGVGTLTTLSWVSRNWIGYEVVQFWGWGDPWKQESLGQT